MPKALKKFCLDREYEAGEDLSHLSDEQVQSLIKDRLASDKDATEEKRVDLPPDADEF